MKRFSSVFLFIFFAYFLGAQGFTYKWQRVAMDTTLEGLNILNVDKIINKYSPGIDSLMEIIAYSEDEITKGKPESALSNLAADVILHTAKGYLKSDANVFSLTNFGGIRTNLPRGAIRIYDVYSVFPFDNSIVIATIKGSEVRKIMERFASRENFEALGGVEIFVENKELKKCYIAGSELDDNKIYQLATIDFLLDGGDKMKIRKNSLDVKMSGIYIRDAVVDYLREITAKDIKLDNKGDGRIIIKKSNQNEEDED